MNTTKKNAIQPKVDLAKTTWTEVQEVAKGEIQANGKMLYIFRNFLNMYKQGSLKIDNYFDAKENDKSVQKMFFDNDKRRTLIAKDFSVFANKVLLPSLNQNLKDFQKEYPYEYRVLVDVAPSVMFGIANVEHFDLSTMLIESKNSKLPVQIEMQWRLFKFDHLQGNEQIFRNNLATKFLLKTEHQKVYYCTFRGERGLYELSRTFFTPKKVEADNVKSAETSAITMAVSKLNDESNGHLGTATTLTQAKENTQGEKRLINELVELEKATIKMIDLIAKSPNTKSRETLLRVYVHIVNKLQSKDFGQYLKVHSKANVEFSPRVKGRPFDTSMGDFNKYLKQA